MKKEYCLGFAFNEDKSKVALIRKTKPEWQAGLLNGIGGKVESMEYPLDAMVREFYEETGYSTDLDAWDFSLTMEGHDWNVHVYHTTIPDLSLLKTTTEEEVVVFDVDNIVSKQHELISNIPWLVSIHLDKDKNSIIFKVAYI